MFSPTSCLCLVQNQHAALTIALWVCVAIATGESCTRWRQNSLACFSEHGHIRETPCWIWNMSPHDTSHMPNSWAAAVLCYYLPEQATFCGVSLWHMNGNEVSRQRNSLTAKQNLASLCLPKVRVLGLVQLELPGLWEERLCVQSFLKHTYTGACIGLYGL